MKTTNSYQQQLDRKFYENMPKAVLAAIAVSFADRIHGESCDATAELRAEWGTLHANGIVTQKPARHA